MDIKKLQGEHSCSSTCSFSDTTNGVTSMEGLDESACRVIQDLTLVLEVSRTLEKSLELNEIMKPVLQHMAASMGMQRGTITILNRDTKEISIEEAYGLTKEELAKSRFKVGDGIIGWVVETGKPVIIEDIAKDENFKDRTPAVAEFGSEIAPTVAFLCVPIMTGQRVLGTLSVERLLKKGERMEADLRLLTIIASVIAQAVSLRQSAQERMEELQHENERLQDRIKNFFRPSNLIGGSSAMRSVFNHIEQVSGSSTTVLIRGESGVGKELVAHAIHQNSNRKSRAFVKVNCAALPDSIIESELFGHEKGAFTGAITMRKGRFEIADGGTIFLDEIGDISPSTQVKLLRVLQEREFERVGSQTPIKCDVRVIAATSRNLEQLIETNRFRVDLYYRLNVFPIYVPPLRERKADILQLADHFVEKYSRANEKKIRRISTAAIDLLMSYHWPGNVRELENCIERAILLCHDDDAIKAHHLPSTLQTKESSQSTTSSGTLESALGALEQELIVDALKQANGNMAHAARALGITERIMGLRVKKHAIDPARYKK